MEEQLRRHSVTEVDDADDIARELATLMPAVGAVSLTKGVTVASDGAVRDTVLVCVVSPSGADSLDRPTLERWLRIRTHVERVKLFVEPR